jgi:hypothetical protein
MQDRPTYAELLEVVQHFLQTDVVPTLEGPKKFHARVAANVLEIVRRELTTEDALLQAEWQRLDRVLAAQEEPPKEREELRQRIRERTAALCERIRAGEADGGNWRAAVVAHVRQTVVDKLAVANPRFLGDEIRGATVAPDLA